MRAFAQAPSAEPSTHGNRSTFPFGVLAAMLLCAAAFLGIGAPAASAAPEAGPGWSFEAHFGSSGPVYELAHAPIGVDSNGNVIVTDVSGYVNIFTDDPVEGWKELENFYAGVARNVAVDLGDNSLYFDETVAFGGSTIRRWVSDGQPTPTYTIDPTFEVPQGESLAVDQSTGDLLVADPGAEAIRRYDSSGTLLETISTAPIAPGYIALAPDGSFWVASASGPDVTHLSSTGTVLGTFTVGALRGLTFDSTREHVVVNVEAEIRTFSTAGQLLSEVPANLNEGYGLFYDSGSDRLFQGPPNGASAYVPAIVPAVEAPTVSDIAPHAVHLEAEVDPGAGPPAESKAHFEYSLDGGENWQSTPDQNLTVAGATTVEADVTGLLANTEFLVRVVASNPLASKTSGTTSFSTPKIAPEVVTAKATDVSETSAVLNGTINPAGLQTTYYFEYGLTTAYGSRVPAGIDSVAGNGIKARAFGRTITGLQPGTTYHFRIVAKNEVGTSEGADETFTTYPSAGILHRAYEQVTPADKHGIAIESGFGFYAKADGEAMAYLTKGGGASAPLNARSITFRGAEDWEPGPDLDPPLDVAKNAIVTQATLGLSPDFSKAFVVSNQELTPDAAGGDAANLYIYDIASRSYTLVGSTPDFFGALNFYVGFGLGGQFLASAPDMSWLVFYSQMPLLENAPFNALYRWSETDGLEVVSILPGPSETPASIAEIGAYEHVLPMASPDSSRIYFRSVDPEPGVYLREGGETKAISVSDVPGEPAGPQPAQLYGVSKDGRYAFLANMSKGVKLTSDATGTLGDLYRYDANDESLEYLGTQALLAYSSVLGISEDGETLFFRNTDASENALALKVWREGEVHEVWPESVGSELASASPNGRYLAFGTPDGRLHFYDAVTEEETCASCLPDGSPGEASLPNLINRTIGNHLPEPVTDGGQFFFTSSSRLVAADVNGVKDVYEYKNGKVRLVSPGNAPFPAIFGDVSKDGNNVFFTTQQKLVGRDNDQSVDIYDARVDGGLPAQSPPAPQECLRDDCKATPNAGPELPFGGSEALSGPENVKPPKHKKCGKGKKAKKVKGKVRCVKKHTKHKAGTNKKGGNR